MKIIVEDSVIEQALEALENTVVELEQQCAITALRATLETAEKAEPLFLLHCGDSDGIEQDDWETEADSGARVDAFAAQHVGETVGLYTAPVASEDQRIAVLEAELANEKVRDIHSCDDNCTRDGCVNRRLREEFAEQCRLNGMGSEREARLQARVAELERDRQEQFMLGQECAKEEWKAKLHAAEEELASALEDLNREVEVSNAYMEENIRFREELAAAQATIAKMREALEDMKQHAIAQWPAWQESARCAEVEEALAIPSDRSCLDAMLAEAREEGMLEAAKDIALNWLPNLRRMEPVSSNAKVQHNFVIDDCVKHVLNYVPPDAIRQAAERGEK